ncbi:DUF1330 domain-containing protein [Vibrio sonorensis]|uniref:DUF1330 domain-containing protein n=1 Tax=Vibrio sonorensis TaxID=1004316 RepID=UPI0008D8F389|nr:DUF1330 domain-containing protein [Vibrio sonorensis]
MAYELLVGLDVTNDEIYHDYRLAMRPLLAQVGGYFGYDFKVSETLISRTHDNINRVFTIGFPNKEVKEAFFTLPEYLEIKSEFFTRSVKSTTIIAEYNKQVE